MSAAHKESYSAVHSAPWPSAREQVDTADVDLERDTAGAAEAVSKPAAGRWLLSLACFGCAVGALALAYRSRQTARIIEGKDAGAQGSHAIAGIISKDAVPDWEQAQNRKLEKVKTAPKEEIPCRKPKHGGFCYTTIMWALDHEWSKHGGWSIFLKLPSPATFEDVQLALHMDLPEMCPRPCPGENSSAEKKDACETAGDYDRTRECWFKVKATISSIKENPAWYQGLGANSSFEDVQAFVHSDPESAGVCPKPCDPVACHTVSYADKRADWMACVQGMEWIKSTGRPQNPEWFPGLDESSTDWDIQEHVAKDPLAEVYCPMPCESDLPDYVPYDYKEPEFPEFNADWVQID